MSQALNLETATKDQLIEKIQEQHCRLRNLTTNLEVKTTALSVAYNKLQAIKKEVNDTSWEIIP